MFLQARKGCCSVGKAYYDGINVHISGIQCYLTDSEGNKLGDAEHLFPYQWILDLSIKEKRVTFSSDTLFKESCITEVQSKVC
jgi:hypothetical protein